jgi:hypothetical protein
MDRFPVNKQIAIASIGAIVVLLGSRTDARSLVLHDPFLIVPNDLPAHAESRAPAQGAHDVASTKSSLTLLGTVLGAHPRALLSSASHTASVTVGDAVVGTRVKTILHDRVGLADGRWLRFPSPLQERQ